MKSNFEAVMVEIFKHEGSYVDHPKDPGGATNMGITHITLADYRGRPVSKAEVRALTKAEAQEIYRKRYWNVIKGDDLPAGVDLVMMDGSVNSGVGRGPKWVQAALRVAQDGKVGPKTISAAWIANSAATINAACDARMGFLKSLGTWPTFGKGWSRRVEEVRKRALEMAKANPQDQVTNPTPTPSAPPDAPIHVEPMPPPASSGLNWIAVVIVAAVVIGAIVLINARIF